jgi:rhamnogalacturonyl hydrolase YesR
MMNKLLLLLPLFLLPGIAVHSSGRPSPVSDPAVVKTMMLKVAGWQLAHPKHALFDWTNGAFYAGICAAYETTGEKSMLNALTDMGEKNLWKPGPRLQHADDYAICQSYLDIYQLERDRKMIDPTIEQMDRFMAMPYQSKGIQVITWWWCDALFMAPPAMVKLSVITGDKKYMEYSDRLWHECYDLLYDKKEHLFARDLSYVIKGDTTDRREANGSKIFWARGNSWVLGGLARILSELPKNYKGRTFYEKVFCEMSERIAALQQKDGLWRASLLDPASYPGGEASGTGFYTYALAWGIRNGLLDKEKYLPVVLKAWQGLNTLVLPDGCVGWCQTISGAPKSNFGAETWEVYGAGAYLLAASEVLGFLK